MSLKNKLLIIVLIGTLTVSKCFGQETPKQLGIEFLNSLISNDSTKIAEVIPKPEIIIEFSKSIGIEKSEEEVTEFLKAYPNEVKQFINRFNQLKAYGEKLGIDWELVEFKNVETNSSEKQITEQGESITMTDLNVIFNYQNKTYRLVLNSIFEYDKVWFLAGDKPKLEKY